MHDYKTFEVMKTYKIDSWGAKVGLWTQNNDKDVFYWFYFSSILSVYFDESGELRAYNNTFSIDYKLINKFFILIEIFLVDY